MDETPSKTHASRRIALRITDQEHALLRQECEAHGTDLSTLLRLRIFRKVKGMRIMHRPSIDVMLLSDIIARLGTMTTELHKNGSNINQIAKRLNQGSQDAFGLDGALRLLEQQGHEIFKILNLIEAAIMGRKKDRREPDDK